MKYSYTIAMFLAVAEAKGDCATVCSKEGTQAWAPQYANQASAYDVQNAQLPHAESLATDGINSLAASYLANNQNKDQFGDEDYSNEFLHGDQQTNDMLCIDGSSRHSGHGRNNDNQLIDSDASRVNANYESCHVGETIIPALKEETQVQQAACYSSDSAAQYRVKGTANNNYKLSGSLTQNECQVQKGGEKSSTSLCLRGNKNKKYSQCGNKALFGCADGSEGTCGDNFGLRAELLDDEALEVTSDPAKRVEEEVQQVIRGAISKTISQCIQFALDEALDHTINISDN